MSLSCERCKRPLKNPKSIAVGMGPVCAGKNGKGQSEERDDLEKGRKVIQEALDKQDDGVFFIPESVLVKDIILFRDGSGAHANVPHRVVYHSPTGFEWGYGGSGPADLALNVLASIVPLRQAWDLHQEFKFKFIAPMPHEGGTIRGEDIRGWLYKKSNEKGANNACSS